MAPTALECQQTSLAHHGRTVVAFRQPATWLQWAFAMAEVRRQRRALLSLDDRMLSDIGMSRVDAWREGTRRLDDLPDLQIRRR